MDRIIGNGIAFEPDRRSIILKNKRIIIALALGFVVANGVSLRAGSPQEPDNTKANRRDRSKSEPTSDQGKNSVADREIMQKIRKAVMDDKSLSSYAHNVKIISQGGKVTLKGPVRSQAEKRSIEQKAADIAGAANVTNEITIARTKKTS